MEETVINVGKYVKDRKLSFYPETLMMFVWKQNLILEPDENIDKTDSTPDDCEECRKLRERFKRNAAVCRKHKAIQAWPDALSTNRAGVGTFLGRKFALFNTYAVFEDINNSNYVYLIWFSSCEKKQYSMYYIKAKKFKNVFNCGYDIQDLLGTDMVLIHNNWQVYYPDDEELPSLENIRY